MRLFGRTLYKPWETYKLFRGNWDRRLAGVFECGVDYSGKSILDAGCNVGVIDYEIAKRLPAFIHGVDGYRPGILAARHIFQGVDVASRFDVADLTNDRGLRRLLRPSYDIVMMMSVWPHIHKAQGPAVSDRVIATLTERCSGIFISKTTSSMAKDFTAVMQRHGFRVAFDGDPLERLFTFVRH